MISQKMTGFLQNNSAIRAMFEEGKRMASIYGAENVYDFSLGNPNVPAPEAVNQAIKDILDTEDTLMVHGYMSNVGYEDVRRTIAESINQRFETNFNKDNLIMTVGAASGLNVIFKTLLNPGDEVIAFSPYFVEYNAYVTNYDGVLKEVSCPAPGFLPAPEKLAEALTEKTKAVIINNPNNPTGVVYPVEIIEGIAKVLEENKVDFIKTSTGFGGGGATFEDIELFSKHIGPNVKMKAAGGISSLDDAEKFLALGADRLGTSRIVKIVKNEEATGY